MEILEAKLNNYNEIELYFFSKNRFNDILSFVRALPGRRYIVERKTWVLPYNQVNLEKIKTFGFICDFEKKIKEENDWHTHQIDLTKLDGFFEYQKEGVKFLSAKNGRAILGDEMGLGKTIQALGYIKITNITPVLIICPASLKINWQIEIEKWLGKESYIINGKKAKVPKNTGITIINYDILKEYQDQIIDYGFKLLVADESHYVKDGKTQRTKAFQKIAKNIEKIIAITGTPVMNRPIELFTILQTIDPKMWNNRFYFGMRYCGGYFNKYEYIFNGASNINELHDYLQPYMIRRLKKDVLKDLPEKIRSFIPIELDPKDMQIYKKLELEIVELLQNGEKRIVKFFETYHKIMLQLYEMKRSIIFDWIDCFIESGKKLVLFATHKKIISDLFEKYENNSVKIDGSVSSIDRQKSVESFQKDEKIKIFIGNIQAAGIGITLTAADSVFFLELPLTPSALFQAEDRLHRIGQKNAVTSYFLIVRNTLEELFLNLLVKKEKVVKQILDGEKSLDDQDLLSELFDIIRRQTNA